jgi:hypothetical protein
VGLPLRTVRRLTPEPQPEPEVRAEEVVAEEPAGTGPTEADLPLSKRAPATGEPAAPAEPVPAAAAPAPAVDVFALEERAVALVASRDSEAGRVAVEAARALMETGKVHAASDLLLQLVASGIAVHEAERELIGVAHALGRSEIAAEREQLLSAVSRLG